MLGFGVIRQYSKTPVSLVGAAFLLGSSPSFAESTNIAVLEVQNPGARQIGQEADVRDEVAPARITVSGEPSGDWGIVDNSPIEGHVTISEAADIVGLPVDISSHMAMGGMPSGMPLASTQLTSGFGMRRHPILGGMRAHAGLDLAAPMGTPVRATSSGVVRNAGWNGGYGLFIALDNGKGVQTRYGHMSRLNVYSGQRVKKGDVIGYVGSTGRSTGPHLHYEVRVNGQAVNPLSHQSH